MKKILFLTVTAAIMILTVSCSSKKEKDKDIEIGSTLEELLELYPKYKIEIFYTELGSYEYNSVESMLNDYGEKWSSAFDDCAIFYPLKSDGEEGDVRFFLKLNLDDREQYKKETTIWLIQERVDPEEMEEDFGESNPAPPPPDAIVGTWFAPAKRGHVAYLEIYADGMAGLYLGDDESDQLYEIYKGTVYPVEEGADEVILQMDFELNWYIYESDGAPITGVPQSYNGEYTLRPELIDDRPGLSLKANDGADLLFGKKEMKMSWIHKSEDSGKMVEYEF